MFRFLIILFILNLYNTASSSIKEIIISQMQLTNNLSFDFIQTIGKKRENGKCVIKYPKKIFCEYNNLSKKIIVSNGKTLIIKNRNSKISYVYPLKKTPLYFLLDKDYLISKLKKSEPREINNKYLNFEIIENNNKINIFFDKKSFSLTGWQMEDMYQNLTITFISLIKINEVVNEDIFKLPLVD